MGSVYQYQTRAGRRYRILYRKPDHSQGQKRGFATKRDAELYLARVEVSKGRGAYVDASTGRIRIGELGAGWLAGKLRLKPSAYRSLESSWRVWVEPHWANWAVADVRHSDVREWIATLSGLRSATTVARALGVLAGILEVASRDGRIASNPARGVELPRKQPKRRAYLTHAQVDLLARSAGTRRTLVDFLAYTGLRWGEASALRVRDYDQLRRRVKVIDNAVSVGGTIVIGTPKTHKQRSVPLTSHTTELLDRAIAGKGSDRFIFGDGDAPVPLPHSVRGWFSGAVARAQKIDASMPSLTPHDLRHTAASFAISAGANPKAVQRMLGHASAAMTLDVYADLFEDDLDAVAVAVDAARLRSL